MFLFNEDIKLLTQNQIGVLYMVASVICFSIMDICIKWLNYYPIGEVFFARFFIGLVPIFFIIPKEKILDLFFKMHDPTQKDMQYPDIGTQYRSEIFYENNDQKLTAIKIKNSLNESINGKIETNISKIYNYCRAEEYHQKYIEKNKR